MELSTAPLAAALGIASHCILHKHTDRWRPMSPRRRATGRALMGASSPSCPASALFGSVSAAKGQHMPGLAKSEPKLNRQVVFGKSALHAIRHVSVPSHHRIGEQRTLPTQDYRMTRRFQNSLTWTPSLLAPRRGRRRRPGAQVAQLPPSASPLCMCIAMVYLFSNMRWSVAHICRRMLYSTGLRSDANAQLDCKPLTNRKFIHYPMYNGILTHHTSATGLPSDEWVMFPIMVVSPSTPLSR
jgi:hypothetical protein